NEDYSRLGFDSGLQFPPHNRKCGSVNKQIDFYMPFHGTVVEYAELAQSYLEETYAHTNVFRTACPSWDQTARVGPRAFIALNGTPANYEFWLKESIRRTAEDFPGQERFVFINAWNEWAEGCHVEPDRRFQRQFLEATLRAKTNHSEKTGFEDHGLPKPAEKLTSVSARLHELQKDLACGGRLRTQAEEDLASERQLLADTYKHAARKRDEIAKVENELVAARQRISALTEELSSSREQLGMQQEKIAALEKQRER